MKKPSLSTLILILIFFVGLSLLLYPTVSDYWNSLHSSQVLSTYTQEIANMDNERYEQIIQEARQYNERLMRKNNVFMMNEQDREDYHSQLDFSVNGIMGYVEIPLIDVTLPISHGTEESVLQTGVGHVEWSSLPVGGTGTHAVISGHRGLPSARLFSDLDKLKVGDIFTIRVLDEVITYMVDQILIVLPDEVEDLAIEQNRDLCTMVTCTPYGINSHRLLVRGSRVENQTQATAIRVTADAVQIETHLVAIAMAVPVLILLLIILLIPTRRRK